MTCAPGTVCGDEVAELRDALREARECLIDHVCKLPLSKRDHGPTLLRIDAALASVPVVPEEPQPGGEPSDLGGTA